MLYVAKASNIAAARDEVAEWAEAHEGYYGTSIGHVPFDMSLAPEGIDLIPWWWPGKVLVATAGVRRAVAAVLPAEAKACCGYTTDGAGRHQWVRSSLTVVQIDFEDDHVVLRMAGRRHSLQEFARGGSDNFRRLFASVYETLAYQTNEPTWGPLDTADRKWQP
jgi:hypothetical protein